MTGTRPLWSVTCACLAMGGSLLASAARPAEGADGADAVARGSRPGIAFDASGRVVVSGVTQAAVVVTPPSLTGTVTAAAGSTPVPSVVVDAFDAEARWIATTKTDAAGQYAFSRMVPGTYFVRTGGGTSFLDVLYNGIACPYGLCAVTAGTPVGVLSGANTPHIDFTLSPGGVVSGQVASAVGTLALSGVDVLIYDNAGRLAARGTANGLGAYSTTPGLPTGTYFARTSNLGGWVDQLHAGLGCPGGACTVTSGTPISVVAGSTSTGVDFALQPLGAISGTVMSVLANQPVSGAMISVYGADGALVGQASSGPTGAYVTTASLLPGTYYVRADPPPGFLAQLYRGVDCQPGCPSLAASSGTVVTGGAVTTGVDFVLNEAGTIAGRVVAAATGSPIAGQTVGIAVYDRSGAQVATGVADATGQYTVMGLPTGSYHVRTDPDRLPAGFLHQVFDGVDCAGACPAVTTGSLVPVSAAETTASIDFHLASGGTVGGRVTAAAGGLGLGGIAVRLYGSTSWVTTAYTDASGVYTTDAVAAGTYYAVAGSTGNYINTLYNGLPCVGCVVQAGTPILVQAGHAVSSVDFALPVGGTIAGTVREALTAVPLGDVAVELYTSGGSLVGQVRTSGGGAYSWSGLTTGSYFLRTAGTFGYVDQLHAGIACPNGLCLVTGGAAVPATVGATTSGVDFALPRTALPAFTDDPLVAGTTPIRAVHLLELRQRVASLRMHYQLTARVWTDADLTPGITPARAVHLAELRSALNEVYAAAGRAAPSYSTPTVVGRVTPITAAQIAELRAAIAAIW